MTKEQKKSLVVGFLAVVAVSYTAWTLMSSGRPKYPAPAPGGTNNAATPAAGVPTTSTSASSAAPAAPEQPINLAEVRNKYSKWAESPARDPFQVIAPPRVAKTDTLRAEDILSLRAVWRQSGDRLAVINGQVLGEGDKIAGYSIEKIDATQVWVRGTNGTEHIDFRVGAPPAPADRNKQTPPRRPPGGGSTVERRLSS